MGKFGTLGVQEICLRMSQAARDMAYTEKLRDGIDKNGLIAVGYQTLTSDAENWTQQESGDNIILTCYPLKAKSTIHRRYFNSLRAIEDAMAKSAQKQSEHSIPKVCPEVMSIGVACAFDIRDDKDNELLMRFYIFVSGEEDFARECCLAARKAIREWSKTNTYEDVRGIIRPCVWTPKIQSA